jgi:dihydroxy-acid dehydratase
MKQLEPLLDGAAPTVTGRTVRENLEDAVVHDDEVIRPPGRAFSQQASIVVLHGSLAPESAITKPGARGADWKTQFTGTAVVYDGIVEAIEGIQKGLVKPGDVLVVRGMGPKVGPAMAGSASRVVFAVDSAGLTNDVAVVTDGQLSGLCNKGLMVAEVSPEAAIGGPLSLVENGDRIMIDVDGRSLDLDVPETELADRRARRGRPTLPKSSGYLSIYQRTVQPMSTGAVLIKR